MWSITKSCKKCNVINFVEKTEIEKYDKLFGTKGKSNN